MITSHQTMLSLQDNITEAITVSSKKTVINHHQFKPSELIKTSDFWIINFFQRKKRFASGKLSICKLVDHEKRKLGAASESRCGVGFDLNYFFIISVCQEWLIREDNALAYQLQNQESKIYEM